MSEYKFGDVFYITHKDFYGKKFIVNYEDNNSKGNKYPLTYWGMVEGEFSLMEFPINYLSKEPPKEKQKWYVHVYEREHRADRTKEYEVFYKHEIRTQLTWEEFLKTETLFPEKYNLINTQEIEVDNE